MKFVFSKNRLPVPTRLRGLAGVFLCAAFFASCTIQYDMVRETEDTIPEMMITNATFTRTENGYETTTLKSGLIEQFRKTGRVLAKDLEFATKNRDGEITSSGSAAMMSADTRNDLYEFFGGILIESPQNQIKITGDSLKWNGSTEQLTGEKYKDITVEKEGMLLKGKGFTASAISQQFVFTSNVLGGYSDDGTPVNIDMDGANDAMWPEAMAAEEIFENDFNFENDFTEGVFEEMGTGEEYFE